MANAKLDRSKKLWWVTGIVAILLISGGVAGLWYFDLLNQQPSTGYVTEARINSALPPSPELQIYKPLLPEQAKEENAKLPFSTAPLETAMPLVLPTNETQVIGRRNAADCLTSAIYYEAGYESAQGKRAVAQVVLNRVRHPAYPKTICGVVYQGAERKTGCQFTFTCDGSLARRPTRFGWEQARQIAIQAISGAVEPSVGMATHYHANYVMPYWAPTLDKVSQIGAHIFYRWKGSWGRRRAFSQSVQLDAESGTLTNALDLLPVGEDPLSAEPTLAKAISPIIADDVEPAGALLAPTPQLKAPISSGLEADQKKSKLVIDEKILSQN